MSSTETKIDLNYLGYQPLVAVSSDSRKDRKTVEAVLSGMGFLDITGDNITPCWATQSHTATIHGDEKTVGVEVRRNIGNQYAWHKAAGKYDTLSLAEKYSLSGSHPATCSIDQWLAQFDACGKPRPGDGVA